MPVFTTPGFQPVSSVTKPEVQAAHGSRFGFVPSPTGPWQPQVNGMPAKSIHGVQHNAGAPPLPTSASPFLQQFSRPPSAAPANAGMQNAMSAPMPVGPPPAIRATPAQVSVVYW